MKALLFAALLLISSSAEAMWIRLASSSPIRENNRIFVAVYQHDEILDYSLCKSSRMRFYISAIYDFDQPESMVMSFMHPLTTSVTAAHRAAERWAVNYVKEKSKRRKSYVMPEILEEGYATQEEMEEKE